MIVVGRYKSDHWGKERKLSTGSNTRVLPTFESWTALTPGRRVTIVGFAITAFMALLVGLALACVPWDGEVKATTYNAPGGANGSGSAADSTIVDGALSPSMTWCPNQPYSAADAPALAGQAPSQGSIGVDVLGASDCAGTLPSGTYDLHFTDKVFVNHDLSTSNGDGDPTTGDPTYSDNEWVLDCMFSGRESNIGGLTVGSDGKSEQQGVLNLTFSQNAPHEAAAICITHQDQNIGNMVPIDQPLL